MPTHFDVDDWCEDLDQQIDRVIDAWDAVLDAETRDEQIAQVRAHIDASRKLLGLCTELPGDLRSETEETYQWAAKRVRDGLAWLGQQSH